MRQDVSIDFIMMIEALRRPFAYTCALPTDAFIPVIQTHASAVLLAPHRVYKLKKPKDFGFFDFSTSELRRHFCGQEVLINSRLAPHVYLGVAPVLAFANGSVRFGSPFAPQDVPIPGSELEGGQVIDYAVVMERLPDEATLDWRVRNGTATTTMMADIADYVAQFHAQTHTSEHIAHFGTLEVIRSNWEENFAQMRPYVGRTLDSEIYERITNYMRDFLVKRVALFAGRIREGRIRDCHGDLRLQHVYLLGAENNAARGIAILDGIEFNERFRYSDVASEIAFLTMELDATGRCDLARAFINRYVAATGDEALRELLSFYSCYRACVRGKVLSFQLDEPEVPKEQREVAHQEASMLFAQAASYAGGQTQPILLLIGGLMGTGKSMLALALRAELGWVLLSSDATRKQLAHLDTAQPQPDSFGQGFYSSSWTEPTYNALHIQANQALKDGRSVLIDASFIERPHRLAMAQEAYANGARILFITCTCSHEIALERLARRWKLRTEGRSWQADSQKAENLWASDGRPGLYEQQKALGEPFDPCQEPGIAHMAVNTELPISTNVEQVLEFLQAPHLACQI
ncbi:MAG TPA: AAA family ATPase [Ktedonobacteraceae bacterium]|nr:AAA family ATPase [Ktedonobacteraceae bacterium]